AKVMIRTEREDDIEKMIGGMPVTAESIGYSRDQLTICEKCGKSNPPNRFNCLYCSAELTVVPQGVMERVVLRPLENFEKGYNIILRPGLAGDDLTEKAARFLGADGEATEKIFSSGEQLPIARVESETIAETVRTGLEALGCETWILSDESLNPNDPPRRLREILFHADELELIAFNASRISKIRYEEVTTIVLGMLTSSKIQTTEKKKRGERQMVEQIQYSGDELILDIYSAEHPLGFRVMPSGFDFSTLGGERELLAGRNIIKLAKRLREEIPTAHFSDTYSSLRHILRSVWDFDDRKDSLGLKRVGLGRMDRQNLTTTGNITQMNKYSRLQRYLT
ncbi:MAG: hypothetical protein KF685_13620, partial [Acidobacteria bacterium]|nr:hypothetical protein [Acidobacteriota bacterium]